MVGRSDRKGENWPFAVVYTPRLRDTSDHGCRLVSSTACSFSRIAVYFNQLCQGICTVCCISCYSKVLCSFAMFNSHWTKVMFACTALAIKKKDFWTLYSSSPPSGLVQETTSV